MKVDVIGAGLAGLSAAVELCAAGHAVVLSEAAPRAGGRCRSYLDAATGLTIDNGNHLVLSGNTAVHAYLARIGAGGQLREADEARFEFLEGGARFAVRPNAGRIPWWILSSARRVPGTGPGDYLALARLLRPPPGARVGDVVRTHGPLWDRLLEPVLLAALNTPAADASAALAARVMRETLAKGGDAVRPMVAEPTLAAAFVDPALDWLRARGATVRTRRLTALRCEAARVRELVFADGAEPADAVVLAVPAAAAALLVPGLVVPTAFNAIVSAHFAAVPPPDAPPLLGLLGTLSEWIFCFPDRISVTISAANRIVDRDRDELAATIWGEVCTALGLTAPLPRWQIVKERRATFAATVEQDALRPAAATRWENLFLAGDWTRTGLPATIEGAIRSGVTAAKGLASEPLQL